ncbi:hypothetical protein FRC08_012877, partial [Ceratobasidium sp. 394]
MSTRSVAIEAGYLASAWDEKTVTLEDAAIKLMRVKLCPDAPQPAEVQEGYSAAEGGAEPHGHVSVSRSPLSSTAAPRQPRLLRTLPPYALSMPTNTLVFPPVSTPMLIPIPIPIMGGRLLSLAHAYADPHLDS